MGGSSVGAFSHLLPSTRWVGEYDNSVFPFILLVVSGKLFCRTFFICKSKYNILFIQRSKAQETDENMIFIGDPLVVHIDKKAHVGNIHTISLGNQNKKCLDIDDFASKNLVFEVKLLNLVEKDNCLFWDGTFTGTLQKVISENCVISANCHYLLTIQKIYEVLL